MFPNRIPPALLFLSTTVLFIALLLVASPASPAVEAAPSATHLVTNLNNSGAGSLRQLLQDTAVGD